MIKKFQLIIALIITRQASAAELNFKQNFQPSLSWQLCVLSLIVIMAIAYFMAKKNKGAIAKQSNFLIIDKKNLGSKTFIYVLEYQNQQFLLADNQQALVLHAIKNETSNAIH
ncbi:MAG: hypothetical protein H0U70_03280 [Tatlockia sp.]|nr:hypothetical protein [Tatlockia sp.]